MEDLEYEIKKYYLNLKIKYRNIRRRNLRYIIVDKEICEFLYIEEFNNIHRQFQRELYLIRMKELLLKNKQCMPNVIKDNIIQFL